MDSTVKPAIRPATHEDLDAVWRMWKAIMAQKIYYPYDESYTREQIEASWINLDNLICVAETDGQVTGAYIVKPNQPGYGSHVANAAYMVDTAYRGKGIGKQLCAHSVEAAKAAGYDSMYLETVSQMTQANRLYLKNGFELLDQPLGQTGHGGCNAFYVRPL